MILRATPEDRSCREYTRVTTQNSAFNQRWRVLAEKSADVGRIEHLLSSRFADLMVQEQELIGRAEFTLEGHYLLTILPVAQQVDRIAPTLDLLEGLAQALRHSLHTDRGAVPPQVRAPAQGTVRRRSTT